MIDKVLFVMEQYCDADPKHGPTNSESQLIGAIESTGLLRQTKRFYYDVLCQKLSREKMEQLLIEDCEVYQPDLIIYSPIQGPLGVRLNPSGEVLSKLSAKVYTHLWDTVADDEHVLSKIPFSDCIGVVDSVVGQRFGGDHRIIQSYAAVDPKYFYDKGLEREIDVSFVGPPSSLSRTKYVNFLKSNGINVIVAGGQRQSRISWEEYSNILARSKISLNFSTNPYDGSSQMKARVLEIMTCGAMLLEENGKQTRKFFEQGKDFIGFDSTDSILEKVHYYLEHTERRRAVAGLGHEKVSSIYNARNCWGYIFEELGFELPESLKNDENYQIHKEKMWSKDFCS